MEVLHEFKDGMSSGKHHHTVTGGFFRPQASGVGWKYAELNQLLV